MRQAKAIRVNVRVAKPYHKTSVPKIVVISKTRAAGVQLAANCQKRHSTHAATRQLNARKANAEALSGRKENGMSTMAACGGLTNGNIRKLKGRPSGPHSSASEAACKSRS